jgi:transposase-like protein
VVREKLAVLATQEGNQRTTVNDPNETKQAVIKKMMPPLNQSIADLARDEGICSAPLYKWHHEEWQKGLFLHLGESSSCLSPWVWRSGPEVPFDPPLVVDQNRWLHGEKGFQCHVRQRRA